MWGQHLGGIESRTFLYCQLGYSSEQRQGLGFHPTGYVLPKLGYDRVVLVPEKAGPTRRVL